MIPLLFILFITRRGRNGISQPETPRRWRSSHHAENSRELQSQFEGIRPRSMEIEEYFVGLYTETFKAIIGSVEARYNISPTILAMEEYLGTTNDKVFAERKEAISNVATHVGSNSRILEMETKTTPATSAEEIGIKLVSNTALYCILQTLSRVVQLLLLVLATTCSPERSFSALRRLKTYLRSTMTKARLNHLAVIHCSREVADSLDLDKLIDHWRKETSHRQNAVASLKEAEEWGAQ